MQLVGKQIVDFYLKKLPLSGFTITEQFSWKSQLTTNNAS